MAMKTYEQVARMNDRERYDYAWLQAHVEIAAAAEEMRLDDEAARVSRALVFGRLAQAAAIRLNEPETRLNVTVDAPVTVETT
jgi:hypothetical protein